MDHSLTKEQTQIVNSRVPRLLINAVPGAGKTETLRACVSHLLDQGVSPDSILILTFGNRTRDELQDRIANPAVRVSTFHGFANQIVRASSKRCFSLANSGQMSAAISETIARNKQLVRQLRQHGIRLTKASERRRLLNFLISTHGDPALEERHVSDPESPMQDYAPVLSELRRLGHRFKRRLRDQGLLSFAQMLELGQHFAQGHQSEIKHVLVDEYQDMDVAQAKLLIEICKNVQTLRIFGDPGQAIYSFMGTQIEDIATLLHAKVATLSTSHRLTHQTAALASSILNSHRIDGSCDGPRPVLKGCRSQQGQERYIMDVVRSLSAQGVPPDRVAVLARTRNELRLVERVLHSHRVAVNPMHRETQRDHLLSMLELLRLVNANKEELRQGLAKARRTNFVSCFLKIFDPIPDTHAPSVTRALLAAARAGSLEGRFNAVKRAYLLALRKSGQGHARTSVEHELNLWQPLIREHKSVRSFKAFVERQHGQFGVTLSTIHSAKGKEWDHVVVINVTDGVIPHVREIQKQNVEEERRLLYVATTRARQHLHLVQAPVFRGTIRYSKLCRLLSDRTLCKLSMRD